MTLAHSTIAPATQSTTHPQPKAPPQSTTTTAEKSETVYSAPELNS